MEDLPTEPLPGPAILTLELESASLTVPARLARPESVRSRSWQRSAEHWAALAPRGLYARGLRSMLLWLVATCLLFLALAPALVIALVNLFVQGDPRRIFFTQLRVGYRGRLFVLYKFRTMRDHAGDDHARVTSFGRLLRNTHLDELPQLLNALLGDMCLIGPRPEMIATERWAARHLPEFSERLALLPGLTGYAQITQGYTDGGDEHAYRQKLELNRAYRERLSFGLDCAILVRTALWMLRGRGWRKK
ncbi:MAG: sugar transferase [Planctomycetes bacterium]|nr:sugar transferase [Planctomycetota bacterium]